MKKFIYLLLALVLACSLGLVTATPAAAQDEEPDAIVLPFVLDGVNYVAEWSDVQVHEGSSSVHLETTGTEGTGDEARILIDFSTWPEEELVTLGDIESISWYEYLVAGYPPHLDISLDFDGDGVRDDILVFEYAYNEESHYGEPWPTYGAVTGGWYQTFSDDGNGPAVIDDSANAWLGSGPPGPLGDPSFIYGTLGEWKAGTVDPSVDADTIVLALEIEVDNWIVQTEAYVDDIAINGMLFCGLIQDAIDTVDPGAVIVVMPGTYTENVVTDKSLTLVGAQVGVDPTVEGARTVPAEESTINATDTSDYVVEVTADGVILDGFTITGIANSAENMAAVILQGVDSCTITNNILADNYKCAINLFSVGTAYSDYNTVSNNVINGPAGVDSRGIKIKGSHNTISGNEVYNIDNPILIWGWDDSETVSPDYNTIAGNTIGPGADTADHKWGVKIKTGHYNTVTGNTITDATEAAIYLYTDRRNAPETDFDPRPASDNISGNIITGGKVGIALLDGANTNTISGNTITGTTLAGILGSLSQWPGDWTGKPLAYTGETDYTVYLQIVGNTIEDNNITDCGHGIAMEYSDDNTLTGNTIEENTGAAAISWPNISFTANGRGVYFDANSSGNVVNYNSITGNTAYGLENANSSVTLDAENNWWGNASGALHAGAAYDIAYGDEVSDYVDYKPWLLEVVVSGVDPITYEKTLALKDVWTLVSTDEEVAASSNWTGTTALADTATIVTYKYDADPSSVDYGYTQVDYAAQLTSVDAYYVKTDGGGGVGINYSTAAPGVVTKSLEAGWNIISCAGETDAYTLLSQLRYVQIGEEEGVGLTSLVGQGSYNQFTGDISKTLVTDAEWLAIKGGDGGAVTLNAFDGFWVQMNADKSFGVIP